MARAPDDVPDALLRLSLCPEVGPAFLHAAHAAFGSHEAVLGASDAALRTLPRMGAPRVAELRAALGRVDARRERDRMRACGVRAVVLGDPDYPALLAPLPHPPWLLWVRGRPDAAASDAVAIVGSRHPTAYGRAQSARFAGAAAEAGIVVVSGGARGVDAEAHRAAIRAGGTTVAVTGSGLGNPYPPEHTTLFDSIVDGGGLLVSEFPCEWPPIPSNFPRRNRIVSGMSLAVLVVEAARTSGALITARIAVDDHGRQVCALPGPVDSPRSAGCNLAIREGWAEAVLAPEDLLAAVRGSSERRGRARPEAGDLPGTAGSIDPELAPLVEAVSRVLRRQPDVRIDELAEAVPEAASRIMAIRTLAELALAGGVHDPSDAHTGAGRGGQVQPMA
jgi:DNA processing protein